MQRQDTLAELQGLSRFQRAVTHLRQWYWLLLSFIAAAIVAYFAPRWLGNPVWAPVLMIESAVLLLVCAGMQSALLISHWRARAISRAANSLSNTQATTDQHTDSPRWPQRWLRTLQRIVLAVRQHLSHWVTYEGLAAVLMALLSVVAIVLVMKARAPIVATLPERADYFLVAALMCWCFLLLVLERYLSGIETESPEALVVARLLRVTITLTLLMCGIVLLSDGTRLWPAELLKLLAILPMLLAAEFVLRALLSVFSPRDAQREPQMLADSLIAGLWRWPLRPLTHLQNELQVRFGIDLRQNWAFGYIRRALLPVIATMLASAWLLSGLREIPIDARGVHERFGEPVAVWQPGFHVGLPWPMSRVRLLENGVVHELATASASDEFVDAKKKASDVSNEPSATADDPAPASANRLWDASHVAEKSQVIASLSGGRQSFHIVNMDVRIMYRIGLDDAAAMAATYHSNDVPALIRSTANRVLVRYFASRTLDGVLGETRVQLAKDIGRKVQADLDSLKSGVEILATVVEAIHPPAQAANAYHSVQAAQITSQAIIARERGKAAEQINLANTRALLSTSTAAATARETVATAQAAQWRFAAERDAWRSGGKAFLMEQYFSGLKGLSGAQLVLVDHRLRNISPTIDLRNFANATATPRNDP